MRAGQVSRESDGRLNWPWVLFVGLGGLLFLWGRNVAVVQNWRVFVGVFFILLTTGLPLVLLTARGRSIVEAVGLGLALSPLLIVAPAYLLRGIGGLSFGDTVTVLGIGWVGLQALFLWRRPRPAACRVRSPNWVALLAGALVVLAVAYPQFVSADVQLSFHGSYHSAIVYEIRAGRFPPTNPALPGEPTSFYWVYDYLLALLMEPLNVSPIQASAALNVTVLVGTLCLAWATASQLGLHRKARIPALLLAVFGANWAGFVVWVEEAIRTGELAPHRAMVVQGDPRVSSMVSKFSNFSGFPVGYLSALLIIYGLARILQERRDGFLWLAVGTASALLLHTTTGVALAASLPFAALVSWLFQRLMRRPGLPFKRVLGIAGAVALAALAVAPVVIPTVTALQGPGLTVGPAAGFWDTAAWALGPLVLIALLGVVALRRHVRPIEFHLLFWGFALVAGALLVTLPGNNQYKFAFLASLPFGYVAAWVLHRWKESGRRPRSAQAVVVGLVCGIVLLNVLVCVASYVGQARRDALPIESTGTSVDVSPEALFVERPRNRAERLFPLVSQRMLYVSAFHLGYMFEGSPEFETRWQTAESLFIPSAPKRDGLARVATAAQEVYLLLESDVLLEDYAPLEEEFDRLEALTLVYDNPNVKAYRVDMRN
jgi:hypothetical protein